MSIILFNQNFSNNFHHYYQTSDLLQCGIKIITQLLYLNYFNNREHDLRIKQNIT